MSIKEIALYYLPYKAYRYYDKSMTRAAGVLLGIALVYYLPLFIYLAKFTDCFYFIEKPGEYYRRHPVTLLLVAPLILGVFLFFELKKKKIRQKYEEYEMDHEEVKKNARKKVTGFIVFTILYFTVLLTLVVTNIIPPIRNCWGN